MSPSRLCRVIRKPLQIWSEMSDQVARRSCRLPNIVLAGYGRATGASVECGDAGAYLLTQLIFASKPMCLYQKAFRNRDKTICFSMVHRSRLVALCRAERRSKDYVATDWRNLPGNPGRNRERRERMVPVQLHGGNRVMMHVTLTTPAPAL